MELADAQEEVVIDPSAVQAALERLRSDMEPEARFMRTTEGKRPAYNVQTAVDAECGIIVAQEVTTEANDTRSLLPMAEAAQQALGDPASLQVVADAGVLERASRQRSAKRRGSSRMCRPIAA